MAIRYDQKTKDEVVSFVKQYNEENGRGGQSAAQRKWDLNPITIKAWLEKAGVGTPGKSGKKKRGKSTGSPKARTGGAKSAAKAGGSTSTTLERMIDIQKQMSALESEYNSLKATL